MNDDFNTCGLLQSRLDCRIHLLSRNGSFMTFMVVVEDIAITTNDPDLI